ncbi:MAG TPA: methyltransferase domain-containing protein [Allosphingosinicella sp.]|nr:methyltransferase domain-containing protein [Allosphingosinicella sp.]
MQRIWEDRLCAEPAHLVDGALIFTESFERKTDGGRLGRIASFIVERVYLGHNRTRAVRTALGRLSDELVRSGGLGLNFGSGESERRPNIVNLDIYLTRNVDVVYDGKVLPFQDEVFDFVMSQEVFEHIQDCHAALREVSRVMKKGAKIYLQLPFTIGYHSVPHDYWRFSVVGIEQFAESQGTLEVLEKGLAVGHGTGFYRVLVEFLATTASVFGSIFYKPAKLAFAIIFYWVKLFDLLTPYASQPDRIAGGYYVIAQRI